MSLLFMKVITVPKRIKYYNTQWSENDCLKPTLYEFVCV